MSSLYLARSALGGALALSVCLICSAADRQASVRRAAWAGLGVPAAVPEYVSRGLTSRGLTHDAARVAARLERTPGPAGAELLHGQTRFELPSTGQLLRVDETAQIDGFGRLAQAEITLTYSGGASAAQGPGQLVRETLDADAGTLRVEHADGRRETRAVSNELPWIYLPVELTSGAWLSTPVAASVARRAAEVSTIALEIRAFQPEVSIASDQFAVPDGERDWVLLGDDLASFAAGDGGALLSLSVHDLGLTLQQQH